jgi:hypothetical protein
MNMLLKDIAKHMCRLVALLVFAAALPVCADENLLLIKPARCIALHQGQTCYQTLKIEWHADALDAYCLYRQDNKTPVLCWENLALGRGNYEFESDTTRKFFLVRKRDNKTLAEFSVEVAWVYDARSKRESHWRIF